MYIKRLSELREIRVREVACDESSAIVIKLVFSDKTERSVIKHDYGKRDLVIYRCHNLHTAHLETSVSDNRNDRS